MNNLNELWPLLPLSVQRGLLVGSEGKLHLVQLAQELLTESQSKPAALQKIFLNLGIDLLHAAWSKDPLDGQLAGQLLTLNEKWPRLDGRTLALVREVASRWRQPDDLRYYRRIAESRDSEKLRRFLTTQLGRDAGNPYWWQQLVSLGLFEQDQDLLAHVLQQNWSGLEPCRKQLAGDIAWLGGQHETASAAYSRAVGEDAALRRARNLMHCGLRADSRKIFGEVLRGAPWKTSEILQLHDALEEREKKRGNLSGAIAIALYSFNKAMELDATLQSLWASDLGESCVWVLNNGSTDATADVLSAWQQRFGAKLQRIDLHVNIGAPAARNWLLSVPDIRACQWMVYLDDDVELPEDWLQKLAAATEVYPDAGVWGCKVVDHAQTTLMQSVDLHLLPPVSEADRQQERRFKVSDLHHQTLDFGQFDYMRPCASVTGCCHLFRLDRLLESGGFDLRFSPSQYDDLEHDIRLNLNGRYAVYQGFLAIRHKKRSGKASRTNTAEFGNSFANMHKLQKKYSLQEYDGLMAWEAEILLRDFWLKRDKVMHWLHAEAI